MDIIIEIKTVYGVKTFYPANPIALTLAELAGTKTLTRRALETIANLPETRILVNFHGALVQLTDEMMK